MPGPEVDKILGTDGIMAAARQQIKIDYIPAGERVRIGTLSYERYTKYH